MGFLDKIQEKVMSGAGKLIKKKFESTVKNLIKEKRLVFLGAEKIDYTNKEGRKQEITLDEMALILVDASGQGNLASVGVTPDDIKDILVKEWNKTGGQK